MTEQEFKQQVFAQAEYEPQMLDQFFDYWSEANKKGKMRFELEKTWQLSKRLKRWQTNNLNWNKTNYAKQSTNKTGTGAARINALRQFVKD